MTEEFILACVFSALFGAMFFGAVIATLQKEVHPAIMAWLGSGLLLFQVFSVIPGVA